MTLCRVALNTPPVRTVRQPSVWVFELTFQGVGSVDYYRTLDMFDPFPFTLRSKDLQC
jgi:hypothetical protein